VLESYRYIVVIQKGEKGRENKGGGRIRDTRKQNGKYEGNISILKEEEKETTPAISYFDKTVPYKARPFILVVSICRIDY
jgi:hypothetical protein